MHRPSPSDVDPRRPRRARRRAQRRQEHAAQRAARRAHRDHQPAPADDARRGARRRSPGATRSTSSSTRPACTPAQTGWATWMNEAARAGRARRRRRRLHRVDARTRAARPRTRRRARAARRAARRAPTVLVINKIDRLKDKAQLLPFLAALGEAHAFAAVVPISARRADGDDRLLEELRDAPPRAAVPLRAGHALRPAGALLRGRVRARADPQADAPGGAARRGGRRRALRRERPTVPHIEVAIHVARESHKRILIGAKGQMLKAHRHRGAHARREDARAQVHLKLWRARDARTGWTIRRKLRELGYGVRAENR